MLNCTLQTSCKSFDWNQKQIHLGGSEYLSLSPWRQIIIMWFKLSYGVTHSAAMQKLHSTLSSKVGTNKAATNNFIFECTPFLLFEADVLTDFWVEANTCYIGQLHLHLNRYSRAPSSQSYYFKHRCWLQWPHDNDPAVVNTYQSFTATLTSTFRTDDWNLRIYSLQNSTLVILSTAYKVPAWAHTLLLG